MPKMLVNDSYSPENWTEIQITDNPVGKQRWDYVAPSSMQRHDVNATLYKRYIPAGNIFKMYNRQEPMSYW